jgi:hypothetical protein
VVFPADIGVIPQGLEVVKPTWSIISFVARTLGGSCRVKRQTDIVWSPLFATAAERDRVSLQVRVLPRPLKGSDVGVAISSIGSSNGHEGGDGQ